MSRQEQCHASFFDQVINDPSIHVGSTQAKACREDRRAELKHVWLESSDNGFLESRRPEALWARGASASVSQ